MAVRTYVENLDTLYTTTLINRMGELADNIFNKKPFWMWMRTHNKFKKVTGGRHIEVPIAKERSVNTGWIGRGDTVEASDFDPLTVAKYEWKYLVDNIVRFVVDDQQNSGRQKLLDIVQAKIGASEETLIELLEKRLVGTSTASNVSAQIRAKGMHGLRDIVPDDPTTVAIGEINSAQSEYSWWRNHRLDAGGDSFATTGIDNLRTMHKNISRASGSSPMTTIMLSDQDSYQYYEDTVDEQKRIVNQKMGDHEFDHVVFNGIPWVWTPEIGEVKGDERARDASLGEDSTKRIYFLNCSYMSYCYDPRYFMKPTAWKEIPNSPGDRMMQVFTACNLTTNRRRVHGVIHNYAE